MASGGVRCKTCSRTLAIPGPDGDLINAETKEQACKKCKRFEELSTIVQAKAADFTALQHRHRNDSIRIAALRKWITARTSLANYVDGISSAPKVPLRSSGSVQEPAEPATEQHPRGSKRPLPPSSSSPTRGQPRKRTRMPEGVRRVSFDASVVFRKDKEKRPADEFLRTSGEYRPGRNAAPEGSTYLDTSGSAQSVAGFFGAWKQDGEWVSTKKGLEMDREWTTTNDNGTANNEQEEMEAVLG